MKTNLKKFISVLFATIFASALIPLSASAVSTNEIESNNSYGTANEIALNGSITANLITSSDTDFFNITPSKNGKLVISFNHSFIDSNLGWIVTVYMRNEGGTYSELMSKDIRLSYSQTINFSPIGAKAGTVYCVKVTKAYNSAYTYHTSNEYSVSNSFTATENYEKEYNNSYETANEIPANTEIGACLMTSSDTDFFKIVADKNEKLNVTFNHTFTDSNLGWIVTIYIRNENGTYSEIVNKTIHLYDSQYVNFDSINAKAGTTYCVKVTKHFNSAYSFHTSNEYSISCKLGNAVIFDNKPSDGNNDKTIVPVLDELNNIDFENVYSIINNVMNAFTRIFEMLISFLNNILSYAA